MNCMHAYMCVCWCVFCSTWALQKAEPEAKGLHACSSFTRKDNPRVQVWGMQEEVIQGVRERQQPGALLSWPPLSETSCFIFRPSPEKPHLSPVSWDPTTNCGWRWGRTDLQAAVSQSELWAPWPYWTHVILLTRTSTGRPQGAPLAPGKRSEALEGECRLYSVRNWSGPRQIWFGTKDRWSRENLKQRISVLWCPPYVSQIFLAQFLCYKLGLKFMRTESPWFNPMGGYEWNFPDSLCCQRQSQKTMKARWWVVKEGVWWKVNTCGRVPPLSIFDLWRLVGVMTQTFIPEELVSLLSQVCCKSSFNALLGQRNTK